MPKDRLWYKLDGHEPVTCPELLEWAKWYETADRFVMVTRLIDGSTVSTVFLGLDHGWGRTPILFETALCRPREDGRRDIEICERYATWAQAEEGHMRWLERCVPPDMIEVTNQEMRNG